ncbi:MAG: nucleotide exchange factor GrpE [Saccharofermentanales bacterium]
MKKQKNDGNNTLDENVKDKSSEETNVSEETAEVQTDDMEVKEQQLRELSDKYIRLAAEYDNFRKRTQKEKEAIYSDSISVVVSAWLPVIDNMERGMQSAISLKSEDAVKVAEGMKMVLRQADDVMASFGVKEVEALGQTFDPNTMEAVMHCEDDSCGENEVIEVLTKGYIKGDRVIRHAIVRVAN